MRESPYKPELMRRLSEIKNDEKNSMQRLQIEAAR